MELASLNRCNLPPWVIASQELNDDPQTIEIQGVRHSNARLFQALDELDDSVARAERLDGWLSVRFQLHHWQEQTTELARRSLKNSYLRFLRGWGVDSSSVEGAVLKGWVESRMGIAPTFHRECIKGRESVAYERYLCDRIRGSARTSAIFDQLDLVYTYTQYELQRRHQGERWLTLYRGQNDAEAEIVETLPGRDCIVILNNLCSFTDDVERAWEFGSTVWQAPVAIPKVFCATWLFPQSMLRSEREVLVIGGKFRVTRLIA